MENISLTYRPKNFDKFFGQDEILGKNSALLELIKAKSIPHSFFFGPPGCGKTTIARIIASSLDLDFFELNGTNIKIDDFRKISLRYEGSLLKPLIFVDEVHRLNITLQEFLLPIMENNTALIIGASTQNPYFALSGAIRSRSMLFEFKKLNISAMDAILENVLKDQALSLPLDSREFLINSSNGDARAMLNLLEFAYKADKSLKLETLKKIREHSLGEGSSEKDTHYDLISAFIKSIRGSDENASIYYLARLIKAKENPEFIARRLVILASEDIGNANPNALNIATSTMLSVAKIGYPEARIILSQCTIYLAASPKSNRSYEAINSALKDIEYSIDEPIPNHIKHFNSGYLYPHDYDGYVEQNYMSKSKNYLNWEKPIGFEKTLKEWLLKIKKS